MTKPKGRVRNERGLVDMSTTPEPVAWSPDLTRCQIEDYIFDLFSEDRVCVRMAFDDRKQVVDFAMVQETYDEGLWVPVCKIDCKHNEVHMHWYHQSSRQTERKVIHPIESADDVRRGWDEAAELIYGRWEDNRRRWSGGRRS
jgi:hypothetical protein